MLVALITHQYVVFNNSIELLILKTLGLGPKWYTHVDSPISHRTNTHELLLCIVVIANWAEVLVQYSTVLGANYKLRV